MTGRAWAMLALALALAAAGTGAAFADEPDCHRPVSTMEIDLCMARESEQADAALATFERQSVARLRDLHHSGACSHCDAAADGLIQAAEHWARLREADCGAAYALAADGSGRNQAMLACLLDHTRIRHDQLGAHLALFD